MTRYMTALMVAGLFLSWGLVVPAVICIAIALLLVFRIELRSLVSR